LGFFRCIEIEVDAGDLCTFARIQDRAGATVKRFNALESLPVFFAKKLSVRVNQRKPS